MQTSSGSPHFPSLFGFDKDHSQMWWQQMYASEGWCGAKEVAVEGRPVFSSVPASHRGFLGWNCTDGVDGFSTEAVRWLFQPVCQL